MVVRLRLATMIALNMLALQWERQPARREAGLDRVRSLEREIVRLHADDSTVASRLSRRDPINIASTEDRALFNSFLDAWLVLIPSDKVLDLDVSHGTLDHEQSVQIILNGLWYI